MKLTITSGGRTVENAWGLVGNVVWSGDKQRAARTLTFRLATSEADPGLPAVECPVGAVVSFWDDGGAPLFQGQVVSRTLSDREPTLSVTAHDRGMALSGNDGTIKVRDETAEAAVGRLCAQYGISAGARFEWDRLTVRVRSVQAENLVIRPKSNLLSSTTTESIENMVNSVGIYDKAGNRLTTVQDAGAVALYWLLETHITQQEGQDAQGQARQILDQRGVSQEVSVECMGDTSLTTGRTVVVQQPATGLSGVCWIESDRHIWQGGNYTTVLTLNLKNVGYQTETGSELT